MGKDGRDGRPVVPAAAARGVPAAPGHARSGAVGAGAGAFALPPGARRTSATSSCRSSGRSTRPRPGRGGQTGDVRWDARDELRLLVTHGTLHVCGWDHAEPEEEAAMRALERRLLGARA